jgi:hypothetical protein
MPTPRFEPLVGVTDGLNLSFATPTSYVSGTLTLWVRGLPRALANDDGATEVDPVAGTLLLKLAPLAEDSVAALYLEPTPAQSDQVLELEGCVDEDAITGTISTTLELEACLEFDEVCGVLEPEFEIEGTIDEDAIAATIEECDP